MVAEHPGRGGADRGVLGEGAVDRLAELVAVPGAAHEVEVEGGVQLVGAQVAREALRVRHPHLADEDAPVLVGDAAPGAVDVVEFVAVDVRVGVDALDVVGQRRVLRDEGRRVDAYARDAALEPEAQDVLVLLADVGVVPVEVGLLRREEVEVPLTVLDPGPGVARELRGPVIGRQLTVLAAPRPEVEALPLRAAGARVERGAEPGVLVGDVVGDDVHDGADAKRAGLGDEFLGLGQGAEGRVDRPVVGDVVPAVGERREVPGSEPDRVDAEFGEVRQLGADTRQVARAVAVAVRETARIDLVDDGGTPPVGPCGLPGAAFHRCVSFRASAGRARGAVT